MSAPPESPSVQHLPRPWPERSSASSGHPGHAPYRVPAHRTSTTAVLGLVLAFLLPLVGLLLSFAAMTRTGAGRAKGRGLAVAGVVVSAVGTLAWTVVLLALLVGGGAAGEASNGPVVVAPVADAPAVDAGAPDADTAADAGRPGTDAGQPVPDAEQPVADQRPDDRTDLAALTPEEWAQVVRDPDAHRGDQVSVFAEVFRPEAAAGALLVNAGTSQPAGELELDDAAFVLAPADRLAGLAEGDVVRVDAVVDGSRSYDTVLGVENTVVALRAASVERVGYLDLTREVTLGAPGPERFGGVEVPLTILHTGDATYNFDVTVTAVSPDGATTYATTSAYVDDLTPGQSGQGVASFLERVPADAVYRVTAVDRYAA